MKTQSLLNASLGLTACIASFYLGHSWPVSDHPLEEEPQTAMVTASSRDGRGSLARSTDRPGSRTRTRSSTSSPGAASFNSILAAPDSLSRMEEILNYARTLTAAEFPEALERFEEAGLFKKNSAEYKILLTSWARLDPQGALAGIENYPGVKDAAVTVVTTWASDNPAAAERWARENFDTSANPGKGNPHMVGVITALAGQDLGSATRLLEEMPSSGAQKDALKSVLAKLQVNDPEAAKAWTLSLAPGETQDKAIQELAENLAAYDPAEAIQWAASSGQETLATATVGIIDSWIKDDPEAAFAWAESQPREILAAAGPELVQEMARQDKYVEASEWLAEHDGNPEFDESIEKLVKKARKDAPEFAADWAARITDVQSREKVISRLVEKWLRDDPARAREYLQADDVPASVRQQLESQTTPFTQK